VPSSESREKITIEMTFIVEPEIVMQA